MADPTNEQKDHDPKQQLRERVANDHLFRPATPEQGEVYGQIRAQAQAFAEFLIDHCPVGRELSTALTKIEEAVFHGNASIARERTTA